MANTLTLKKDRIILDVDGVKTNFWPPFIHGEVGAGVYLIDRTKNRINLNASDFPDVATNDDLIEWFEDANDSFKSIISQSLL